MKKKKRKTMTPKDNKQRPTYLVGEKLIEERCGVTRHAFVSALALGELLPDAVMRSKGMDKPAFLPETLDAWARVHRAERKGASRRRPAAKKEAAR